MKLSIETGLAETGLAAREEAPPCPSDRIDRAAGLCVRADQRRRFIGAACMHGRFADVRVLLRLRLRCDDSQPAHCNYYNCMQVDRLFFLPLDLAGGKDVQRPFLMAMGVVTSSLVVAISEVN